MFHPHLHEAEPGSYVPTTFADPANSFHEKAALCRAAENTCYFATVNCASPGSPTTSAVVRPDGTLLSYQPYGKEGLLVADIDIAVATGLLASRCRSYRVVRFECDLNSGWPASRLVRNSSPNNPFHQTIM